MFTGTYPHVNGHRSLTNLIKPHEPNLFRSLKEDGYHVALIGPRGDTFAAGVTELSVTEVRCALALYRSMRHSDKLLTSMASSMSPTSCLSWAKEPERR